MDEQKIKELIEVYKLQRDQIIHQANLQVAELTGAIKALEELLEKLKAPSE